MDFVSLLNSPVLNRIGLLLGVVGLFLSWFFYVKSVRKGRISWTCHSVVVVEPFVASVPYLAILNKDAPVKSLKSYRIAIWNDGTETIDSSALVTADPLRFNHQRKRPSCICRSA